ncbi:DUF443 family protein [Virgibacillus sp. C22-A2]|uniref:DUF443 family protein n=1 Tax=Virgibacillus tibetensis TaxID=3042313 RepID=A0ABU6KJ25_9BACI|nr:DUF443 family protein [Virgibacillus sp. C22-A2]
MGDLNCEVQRLENNIRYRILIINGEQYILDMERSFWKIIFPFFVWMLPNKVYKVENSSIVEQLKEPNKEKVGSSWVVSLAGISYFLGILLAPLMDYFEIPISPLVNIMLLIISLNLVVLLYLSISHNRKKKLESTVKLEMFPKHALCIRPKSKKQVFTLLAAYIWLLGFDVFIFMGYVVSRNIMLLIIASGLLFLLLLLGRITVEECHTTIRFKNLKRAG